MERILENGEMYKSTLEKSITVTTVLLVVAVVIAIALGFVFAYWRKTIINGSDDKKKAKPTKKLKRKKDKKSKWFELVEWYVALAVVVVVLLFAFISGIQHIVNLHYDIANEAFVLHDGEYSVVVTSEPVGRHSYAARYYLSFDNGAEVLEIPVSLERYEEFLEDGRHDDVAFVYSEKSKVLLDMWRK